MITPAPQEHVPAAAGTTDAREFQDYLSEVMHPSEDLTIRHLTLGRIGVDDQIVLVPNQRPRGGLRTDFRPPGTISRVRDWRFQPVVDMGGYTQRAVPGRNFTNLNFRVPQVAVRQALEWLARLSEKELHPRPALAYSFQALPELVPEEERRDLQISWFAYSSLLRGFQSEGRQSAELVLADIWSIHFSEDTMDRIQDDANRRPSTVKMTRPPYLLSLYERFIVNRDTLCYLYASPRQTYPTELSIVE